MPCPSSLETTTNPKLPCYTWTPPGLAPPSPPPRPSLAPPPDSPAPSSLTLCSPVVAHPPPPEAPDGGPGQEGTAGGGGWFRFGHVKKSRTSSSEWTHVLGVKDARVCPAVSPDGKWRRGGRRRRWWGGGRSGGPHPSSVRPGGVFIGFASSARWAPPGCPAGCRPLGAGCPSAWPGARTDLSCVGRA